MRAAAHRETQWQPRPPGRERTAPPTVRSAPLHRSRSSARRPRAPAVRHPPPAADRPARRGAERELRAAQRDPRRHDDPVLAVQEGALERGRPDLLPAPPAVRQARRGAARAHRRDRRARPDAGRDQRRRPAARGRADDDRARTRRRRGDPGRARPAARGARDDPREGPQGHRDDRGVEGLRLQRPADGRRPAPPRDAGLVHRPSTSSTSRSSTRRCLAGRARTTLASPEFREPAATRRRRTTSATRRRSLHRPATGSRSKECSTRVSCCPAAGFPGRNRPHRHRGRGVCRAGRRHQSERLAERRDRPGHRGHPRRLGGRVRPARRQPFASPAGAHHGGWPRHHPGPAGRDVSRAGCCRTSRSGR